MAAGARSPDCNAFGIDAILGGMRAQPADGRLTVFDLGGKNRLRAVTVIEASQSVAFFHERQPGRVGFIAADPTAAVNPHQQRRISLMAAPAPATPPLSPEKSRAQAPLLCLGAHTRGLP